MCSFIFLRQLKPFWRLRNVLCIIFVFFTIAGLCGPPFNSWWKHNSSFSHLRPNVMWPYFLLELYLPWFLYIYGSSVHFTVSMLFLKLQNSLASLLISWNYSIQVFWFSKWFDSVTWVFSGLLKCLMERRGKCKVCSL